MANKRERDASESPSRFRLGRHPESAPLSPLIRHPVDLRPHFVGQAKPCLARLRLDEGRWDGSHHLRDRSPPPGAARLRQLAPDACRPIAARGFDRPEVQLGGIYGLEQIARQAPDNRLAVTEVLVAYLRRRSPQPIKPSTQPPEALRLRAPEVQAALTVLTRRTTEFGDPPLNLSDLDLSGADLSGLYYAGDGLRYKAGNLTWANLRRTDLRGATFSGVYLGRADFRGADLRGASYEDVNDGLSIADDFPGQLGPDSLVSTALFLDARADAFTKWPPAFDWRDAGVKMS